MIFKKGGRIKRGTRFIFDNAELEIVTKFTYLGIIFTCGGSFLETQKALAGQALKALFKLKSYLYKFTNLSITHNLELFDKLVMPILLYGTEISGFNNCDIIEKVHTKFCKQLLGVRPQTQNNFIYGELGRIPLKQQMLVSIIRYWLKISQSSDLKIVKHVYNLMLSDMQKTPNVEIWTKKVKNTLESMGFFEAWIFGVGNPNLFIHAFKERIRDVFIQNWYGELNLSTRADSYRLFSDFGLKNYLNTIKICKLRYALCRFRVSAHRLNIETGRWHKPDPIPRNERKCFNCNCIEDEYHFLLECPIYSSLRKKYIKHIHWKRPNILKFINVMSSTDEEEVKKLALYIHNGFEARNNIILNTN
jgi:hypothetical protein